MKVNFDWLQDYFESPLLPSREEVLKALIFHSFEVEETDDPVVLDVDVLPNRAHDCLSHRGIAKELSVIFNIPLRKDPLYAETPKWQDSKLLAITIEDPNLCRRYSACVIKGVSVRESPEWLKKRLLSLGQRPINNVVDATNYVMLSMGQPLHAFDMAKLQKHEDKWSIGVRQGRKGEKLRTLDEAVYELDSAHLLITDGVRDIPIGIAGVKGGLETGINESTKDVIMEAANFDPASIRKTARSLHLLSDAAKRFENGISPELTTHALREVVALIQKIGEGEVEGARDEYHAPHKKTAVSFSLTDIGSLIGVQLSKEDVEGILARFAFAYEEHGGVYTVTSPYERLDLRLKEDFAEEIGRMYGYEKIPARMPPDRTKPPEINTSFYYAEKIRDILAARRFSEVYTYSLREGGVVCTKNPLAEDKGCLRKNIFEGICESIIKYNRANAPLLGLSELRIFEIGKVFPGKEGEYKALSIVVADLKGGDVVYNEAKMEETVTALEKELKINLARYETERKEGIREYTIDMFIEDMPQPAAYLSFEKPSCVEYVEFSYYPYVLRDIAVWVPTKTPSEDVGRILTQEAGELLIANHLFDEYQKERMVSYAFRLVFQAKDRTLTDSEVNDIMEKITKTLNKKEEWRVR